MSSNHNHINPPDLRSGTFLRKALTGGALGTLCLNAAGQMLLLATLAILTRLMTTEEFGLYALALSVLTLLALPFIGGFPVFILRHVAAYRAQDRYDVLLGLYRAGLVWIILGSFVLAGVLWFAADLIGASWADTMRAGVLFIPCSAALLFFGAMLRGMKNVVLGRIGDFLIQPLAFFFVALFLFLTVDESVSADQVFYIHIGSLFIGVLIAYGIFRLKRPPTLFQAQPVFEYRVWFKSALPLMIAVGLTVLNTNIDIVMVGFFMTEEDAGIYRVAGRVAALIPFVLLAANNAAGPYITDLYQRGETGRLQMILTFAARGAFAFSLPLAAIFLIWPEEILAFGFGAGYELGAGVLIILTLAALFNVFCGQAGQVMALSGHEICNMIAVLAAVAVNIILNIVLIPICGIYGAALASAAGILVWNMLLVVWTIRKTGLSCTALGPMRKRSVQK